MPFHGRWLVVTRHPKHATHRAPLKRTWIEAAKLALDIMERMPEADVTIYNTQAKDGDANVWRVRMHDGRVERTVVSRRGSSVPVAELFLAH